MKGIYVRDHMRVLTVLNATPLHTSTSLPQVNPDAEAVEGEEGKEGKKDGKKDMDL